MNSLTPLSAKKPLDTFATELASKLGDFSGRKVTVATCSTSPLSIPFVQETFNLNVRIYKKPVRAVLLKEESYSEEKSSHTFSVSETTPATDGLFNLLYIQSIGKEKPSYVPTMGCQSDLKPILQNVNSLNYLKNREFPKSESALETKAFEELRKKREKSGIFPLNGDLGKFARIFKNALNTRHPKTAWKVDAEMKFPEMNLNKFISPQENVVRVFAVEQDSNKKEKFCVYMKNLVPVNRSKNSKEESVFILRKLKGETNFKGVSKFYIHGETQDLKDIIGL